MVFYLGRDGFYMFNGSNSIPIGVNKVDKTFWADVDQTYMANISSTIDPINTLVMWAYPGAGNTGGMPNHILAFNWSTNKWSSIDVDVEVIFSALQEGYTLDQLDSFGTMDALPYSLDSRVWMGGADVLSGIDLSHYLGHFTGTALDATIETGEQGSDNRALVTSVRPVVSGYSGVTAQVGSRNLQGDSTTWSTASSINSNGECPVRVDSRYFRVRLNITGGFTHAVGVDALAKKGGKR